MFESDIFFISKAAGTVYRFLYSFYFPGLSFPIFSQRSIEVSFMKVPIPKDGSIIFLVRSVPEINLIQL